MTLTVGPDDPTVDIMFHRHFFLYVKYVIVLICLCNTAKQLFFISQDQKNAMFRSFCIDKLHTRKKKRFCASIPYISGSDLLWILFVCMLPNAPLRSNMQ